MEEPMTLLCEVCHGESGGEFRGVASIPGAPMSIAWCSECLKRDTAPAFVFEHDFIFVAGGNLDNLVEWAKQRETWADGRYMGFEEYVQRISPEDMQKAFDRYADALEAAQADDLD